jgi:exosortase A-associated hydrolase 1
MEVTPYEERPVVFGGDAGDLIGLVTSPRSELPHRTGVLVVVGGPQYRVGSHRQFTLLCRQLAAQGIASFRFDYHGLGDSDGPPALGVDGIESDMRRAIDVFMREVPALGSTVLWGLCGAASASALYAPGDRRVSGLIMLNPWVRTEEGLAKARMRHYYLGRVADPDFWRRFVRGEVAVAPALRDFLANVSKALGWARLSDSALARPNAPATSRQTREGLTLPDRMLASLQRSGLPALVILSGNADLTANEFRQVTNGSTAWRQWLASGDVQCREIEESNHTFARSDWRDRVAELTASWVLAL